MRARNYNSWGSPHNSSCGFMDLKICPVLCPLMKPMMPDCGLVLAFPDTEGLCKPHSHLCSCTGHKVLELG